ncbi:MAG: neutral/alkaline non-lysosomal ceramidase N-terminal domain-containing protein [Candidatus Omnitrophica bacterium]|nr:neutral/alkaline non-lysosomal ceramidase N-terminal domain-containing protein [Candidatus Omnitrophota bacterium]
MKIGFGKAVITPPVGFSLVGYFHDRRSTGIRDELYSTACLIEDGGTLFAVASVELVWIDSATVNSVREIVRKTIDIPASNILIHATHTHTGPISGNSGRDVYKRRFYSEPCYIEMLPFYIAGSIKAAYESRKESLSGASSTQAEGLAFNRRYLLKDGRVITNPWNRTKDIIKSAGPVDNTLSAVKVTDKKTGMLTGIIVNFACHPDTLGDNLISADWPGMLRNKLKKQFPCAEVLVLNGPSGDINHINPENPGRRGLEVPDHIAETLKNKTVRLLGRIKTDKASGMRAYGKKFAMPAIQVSPSELKSAREVLKKKKLSEDSLQYMVSASLVQIAREQKGKRNKMLEINGFSIGRDLLVLGLPGEIFTDISLQIKKLSPFKHTLIAQNSNAQLGYVPSETAFIHDERNKSIKPGYGTHNLAEAIGIDCSYETSPLACNVGKSAEKAILKTVKALLK